MQEVPICCRTHTPPEKFPPFRELIVGQILLRMYVAAYSAQRPIEFRVSGAIDDYTKLR